MKVTAANFVVMKVMAPDDDTDKKPENEGNSSEEENKSGEATK
jgi:hypothetical protein